MTASGTLVLVSDEPTTSPESDAADTLAFLEGVVESWLSVPDAAELQGIPLSSVRTQLKERQLLAVRRGPNRAIYIPAVFLTSEGPLQPLPGTVTVLADGGMDDLEILTWLFTPQDGLAGDGTPMGSLLAGHKAEVRLRAMETAF